MTAISFSLTSSELHSKDCTSLIEKAKHVKTIQYVIPSCTEFKIGELEDQLDDLKRLQKNQDVLLSISISDTSFTLQKSHDLIKHFVCFLESSEVTRIDFDFSLFTGRESRVLKKIGLLIKSTQKYFNYSLFVSATIAIGIFHGVHEHELGFLSFLFRELIHISMVQFTIRSENKKKSISWYDHLKLVKTKVDQQFDAKFSRYFKHARKPLIGLKIHYTSTQSFHISYRSSNASLSSQKDIELQSCLKFCQEESIASLSFDISKSSAEKLDSMISSIYIKTVIPEYESRLLLPAEVLDLHPELLDDITRFELLDRDELDLPSYSSSDERTSDDSLPSYQSLILF